MWATWFVLLPLQRNSHPHHMHEHARCIHSQSYPSAQKSRGGHPSCDPAPLATSFGTLGQWKCRPLSTLRHRATCGTFHFHNHSGATWQYVSLQRGCRLYVPTLIFIRAFQSASLCVRRIFRVSLAIRKKSRCCGPRRIFRLRLWALCLPCREGRLSHIFLRSGSAGCRERATDTVSPHFTCALVQYVKTYYFPSLARRSFSHVCGGQYPTLRPSWREPFRISGAEATCTVDIVLSSLARRC